MQDSYDQGRRLSEEQIAELVDLYENKGWKVNWIALKLDKLHHTSVLKRIKEQGLVRKVEQLKEMPLEVQELYETIRPPKARYPDYDSYIESNHEYNLRMFREECKHEHFTILCPVCKQVLGSEANCIVTRKVSS